MSVGNLIRMYKIIADMLFSNLLYKKPVITLESYHRFKSNNMFKNKKTTVKTIMYFYNTYYSIKNKMSYYKLNIL